MNARITLRPTLLSRAPGHVAAIAIFLACILLSKAAIPTPDEGWWFTAPEDTEWTNKPLEQIRQAAGAGDPTAQYYLSRAWFFGISGKRDMNESLTWVKRSAEQGYPQAELLLGRFYY